MYKKLLISGETRSGTTLLANFLNSQNNITIYRDYLIIEQLKKIIEVKSICEPLSMAQKTKIIYQFCFIDNAKIGLIIDIKIEEFATLNEFYKIALHKIASLNDAYVGHKATKTYKVVPELLNNNPDLKIIYIVRDPRDVMVSALKEFPHENIFDHVERWKIGSKLLRNVLEDKNINDRVCLVRFEDLITDTPNALNTISQFLNIHNLMIPTELRDYNQIWLSNTSHNDVNEIFDQKAVNRWKLNDSMVIDYTENLLQDSMKPFDYEISRKAKLSRKILIYLKFYVYTILNKLPIMTWNLFRFIYNKLYKPFINIIARY